jgi:hypothetical protein
MNHMKNPAPERLVEQTAITVGARVRYYSDGHQAGTVSDLIHDISNGQLVAVINVDHDLSGIVEMMPVTDLHMMGGFHG